MTEEQLNKEWLIRELKGFSYSNELLDKILELLSEQYINGLEQSRFDKRMLEHENCELRKEKQEWIKLLDMFKNQQKEFIEWLEEKIKVTEDKLDKYDELVMQGKETDIEYYESMINKGIFDACKDCLSKYKNIVGGKE